MHKSGAPHSWKCSSVEDLSDLTCMNIDLAYFVSGLQCTWLVCRTRTSSNDVDNFFTLRMDPLEEGRSTWRVCPNRYLRGHRIMLCGLCPWSPTVALHVLLNSGVEAALICLDSLRFPRCARAPHVASASFDFCSFFAAAVKFLLNTQHSASAAVKFLLQFQLRFLLLLCTEQLFQIVAALAAAQLLWFLPVLRRKLLMPTTLFYSLFSPAL
ncbi:hypothetical protein M9H77_31190 [Catharanthus roseus]|uniref:Uncharacterized protein n=1 Tax=Catharanthus roseus TaxID=4058 RepID=A0ACC0A1Q4_CATRO|nr:hypothetical protein M9H77_31190 [Catharanthus roseus]